MSILTETAPKRIYLCVSDDPDHYNEPYPEVYPEDEAITWSTDQPVACTVEYVRSDLHEGPLVVRNDGSRCTLRVWALEIKQQRDALAVDVERLRKDITEESSALMVEIPEPGTDMAKVMRANRAIRRERDNAIREHDRATTFHAIAVRERDFERMRVDRLAVERANAERERDIAIAAQAATERERDHAWETCKRALHKVDNLIARAEKAEKDRDAAEVERDDAVRTAQDNALWVERMRRERDALVALLREAPARARGCNGDWQDYEIRVESALAGVDAP